MTPESEPPLRVGLINAMPPEARRATERQFHSLVREANRGRPAVFMTFEFEGATTAVPEGDCATPSSLGEADIDALIVTGAEPHHADLRQEAHWAALAAVAEWAAERPVASYWSCLAAHAASLHLDGVQRRRLPTKLSGVYSTEAVAEDRARARVPHSRFNGVDESDLVARGYAIHSRGDEVGVDAFVRPGPGLFLLHQGHPEYAPDALAYEWRRDLRRFLAGERTDAPDPPTNLFAPDLDAAIAVAWRRDDVAAAARCLDLTARPVSTPRPWRDDSVRLFRFWLDAARLAVARWTSAA